MMKIINALITLSCLFFLTACGEEAVSTTAPVKNTNLLAHQMDALQKAKNLEAELNDLVKKKLDIIDGQK